jgi:8-oxo-dGTP diphosphatase
VFTPILATLGYVVSPDRNQVLMIHRNRRPDDYHFGKYNGLGGRLEAGEDVVTGMRREIQEESGLIADGLILRGTVSWPGFGRHGEGWFAFIFRIDDWHGEVYQGNHEGTLEWVPRVDLLTRPIWPSDHYFIPMVFDDDPRPFHGHLPYDNGEMGVWNCVRV